MMIGARGEDRAVAYLRDLRYVIYARNVRMGKDEIDIVAWDPADRAVVFVEVKTRSGNNSEYLPELNITYAKKKRMRRAALAWVDRRQYEGSWRMEAVMVVGIAIEHHFVL